MSEVEIFDFKGNNVRTVLVEGEPWFVGKDVAKILGYRDTNRAVNQHVDSDERKPLSRRASGDSYASLWTGEFDFSNKVVINESGMYSLVLNSELPQAKEFKHWVTHEVLPSIRKTGVYMTDQKAYDITHDDSALADLLIQAGNQLKEAQQTIEKERTGRLIAEQTIGELQPKADYCNTILESNGAIATSVIAKDYGLTPQSLNKILHDEHIQYKTGKTLLLYQDLVDLGYTKSNTFYDENGWAHVQTKWTQKGRLMINDLLKEKDILPLMDRK